MRVQSLNPCTRKVEHEGDLSVFLEANKHDPEALEALRVLPEKGEVSGGSGRWILRLVDRSNTT